MDRTIQGPTQDLLTAKQTAGWLGLGLTAFRSLVSRGMFPLPVHLDGKKSQRWYWMDAVAFAWLRSRPHAAPSGAKRRKRRS